MGTNSVTVQPAGGPPFVVRVLWFIFIGWELTGIWILIAWLLNLTVVGLPLGLWMLDRVPQVLTLKPSSAVVVAQSRRGQVWVRYGSIPQRSWLIRFPYFLVIGWWFSLLWAAVAWLLCATIIGLPLGVWMLNRLPNVTTLWRG